MVVRALIVVCVLFTLGCGHHMQTRSSCSLEPYAIIEFINFEEVDKVAYVQRHYGGKPLGEPIINVVEPKSAHRYRVHPGIYEFGVRRADGRVQGWLTLEGLGACDTLVVNMRAKSTFKKPPIRSRRAIQ